MASLSRTSYSPAAFSTVVDDVRDPFKNHQATSAWWMRKDYNPSTPEECECVVKAIRDNCDRPTWVQCMEIKRWLSRHTSDQSSAS